MLMISTDAMDGSEEGLLGASLGITDKLSLHLVIEIATFACRVSSLFYAW